MKLNLADAARHVNKSQNTIRKWLDRGLKACRAENGEWQIDPADLDAWAEPRIAADDTEPEESAKAAIDRERARKLAAEAEMAEIDLAMRRGDAISLADAGRAWAGLVSNHRATLMSMPTKIGPLLVGEPDLLTIVKIMEGALHEALDELANYDPGDLQDSDRGPSGNPDDPASGSSSREAPSEADGEPVGGPLPETEPGE